jgi:pyridoxamine 5'-phosphate oxidase family protein
MPEQETIGTPSVFTERELAYLTAGGAARLARVATVGADGTPHVVPSGFRYDAARDGIELQGFELERTKKFHDVRRSRRAAVVIDDLQSTDPWRPRGIEVRGAAEAVAEPRAAIRLRPERIVSWGIEHDEVGRRFARSVPAPAADAAAAAPPPRLDPARTALLVIDVQRGFVDEVLRAIGAARE